MNTIIPAILAKDETDFLQKLDIIESVSPVIQLDVLDNTLYPNTSWCDLKKLGTHTETSFELHLMVDDPEPIIHAALELPNIKRIIWHIEAMGDHRDLIRLCHAAECEAGIALAPKTTTDTLQPYGDSLDTILVLGVEPGFSGQNLIQKTIAKAHDIHTAWPKVMLAFDGGVTRESIPVLREAGVSRFCIASAIFTADDPAAAFRALQNA
jgi:ribulose-phosphate 3-epimerase